jgi:hypothetical protein
MAEERRQSSYVCACACGEVFIELFGEPIDWLNADCYCNDCSAACFYVDDKAQKAAKQNISMSNSVSVAILFKPISLQS